MIRKKIVFYPSTNYKLIRTLCKETFEKGESAIILGEPGLGKTKSISKFVAEINDDRVIVFHSHNMKYELFIFKLLKLLVEEKNEASFQKSKAYEYELEVYRLLDQRKLEVGSLLLIIDDFRFSNGKYIVQLLKSLSEIGVGIVLLGTPDDYTLNCYSIKRKMDFLRFNQLFRGLSIDRIYKLNPPSSREIKYMALMHGLTDYTPLIGCKTFTELKSKLKTFCHEKANY